MTADPSPAAPDTPGAPVGPSRWSWLYLLTLIWMASLTTPTFQAWQGALARHRGEEPDPNSGWGITIALMLATVVLGFVLGWKRRWTTLWLSVFLGGLVMSVGVWVDYNHSWSGGEPMPEPGPFLMSSVLLGVLLWSGAGLAAVASAARHRAPSRRLKSAI